MTDSAAAAGVAHVASTFGERAALLGIVARSCFGAKRSALTDASPVNLAIAAAARSQISREAVDESTSRAEVRILRAGHRARVGAIQTELARADIACGPDAGGIHETGAGVTQRDPPPRDARVGG
jgi:hypothetical protein